MFGKNQLCFSKNVPYLGLSATINKPEKLCEWNENQLLEQEVKCIFVCLT